MLLKEGPNCGEYEIQFAFDFYLYTFRFFEFGGEIYVQVWQQHEYDLMNELFVTADEAKNLINESAPLLKTIRLYPGEDGMVWEKQENDLFWRVEFQQTDLDYIRSFRKLFDKGIDWVKSREGADWSSRKMSVKKPENNYVDMYLSRKNYFSNYL